jgi:hypothetical protein
LSYRRYGTTLCSDCPDASKGIERKSKLGAPVDSGEAAVATLDATNAAPIITAKVLMIRSGVNLLLVMQELPCGHTIPHPWLYG